MKQSAKPAKPSAGVRRRSKSAPRVRRHRWIVQDARAHFSEVIDAAMQGHPQQIVRAGKEAVFVISAKEYMALTRPKLPLREFFLLSPLADVFGEEGIPTVRHKERLKDPGL